MFPRGSESEDKAGYTDMAVATTQEQIFGSFPLWK